MMMEPLELATLFFGGIGGEGFFRQQIDEYEIPMRTQERVQFLVSIP